MFSWMIYILIIQPSNLEWTLHVKLSSLQNGAWSWVQCVNITTKNLTSLIFCLMFFKKNKPSKIINRLDCVHHAVSASTLKTNPFFLLVSSSWEICCRCAEKLLVQPKYLVGIRISNETTKRKLFWVQMLPNWKKSNRNLQSYDPIFEFSRGLEK